MKPTNNFVEVYRITAECIAKLFFPVVIVFVVVTFRSKIDFLLDKTIEAEFGAARLKFAQPTGKDAEQENTVLKNKKVVVSI